METGVECDADRVEFVYNALRRTPESGWKARAAECISRDGRSAYRAVERLRSDGHFDAAYGPDERIPTLVAAWGGDRTVVSSVVRFAPLDLGNASARLRDDAKIVSLAVAAHGDAIRYASDRLCDDPSIRRVALRTVTNGLFCEVAGDQRICAEWFRDSSVRRALARDVPDVYLSAMDRVRPLFTDRDGLCDQAMLLRAVRRDWYSWYWIPDELIHSEAVTVPILLEFLRGADEYTNEHGGEFDAESWACEARCDLMSRNIAASLDHRVILATLDRQHFAFEEVDALAELLPTSAFDESLVSKDAELLQYASTRLRADRAVVRAAVAQDGLALRHASAELRADRAVVRAAVAQDGLALQHASAELRTDRAVVRVAVAQDGLALQHASAELRADRAVVRAAVAQDGDALQHASAELRTDRAVIRAAVAQNGHALQHASAELRTDRAVVRAAVAQNAHALQHASAELRADRAVVLAAVAQNGHALQHASAELRADRAVVRAAVARNGLALQHASAELRADRAVVLAAVAQNGHALQHASAELRADRAVVQAAVYRTPCALVHASDGLQNDLRCLTLYLHRYPTRDAAFPPARAPVLMPTMPTGCALAADEVVARIAAWLADWRAMEVLLEGVYDPPRASKPPCAAAVLQTGDGAITRRVAGYVGTPGHFAGVRGLRVVDASDAVVRALDARGARPQSQISRTASDGRTFRNIAGGREDPVEF